MRQLRDPMPRRRFLRQGGYLAGLGAVLWTGTGWPDIPITAAATSPRPVVKLTLDMFTKAIFDQYLGETFRLQLGDGQCALAELVECAACSSRRVADNKPGRDPFSLVFRVPKDVVPPQCIYRLEHERLGSLDVFLVPIGPDDAGMRLEAVFA